MGNETLPVQSIDQNGRVLTEVGACKQRMENDGTGRQIYQGFAKPGSLTSAAVWLIRKFTYTAGVVTQVDFADGDSEFDNVWDNRTGLSYS